MNSCAGNDKKRCSCECPEGRSFPHEREVMPGIAPLGKPFFSDFFRRFCGSKTKSPERQQPLYLSSSRACSFWRTNRKENNPAQTEAEEHIFDRAGCKRGDVC